MKKIILIFTILILVLSVFAQNGDKRIALIIGNAAYKHGGALKNPVNDAELMASTLRGFGFEVIQKNNANLKTMQLATADFTNRIPNYDVALFFYAGHGIQVKGENYLIPVDAKMESEVMAQFEAFNINFINNAFTENAKNMNIMILDACRNDPFRSWMRGGTRGFKAVSNQAAGTIIAYATREGETASDGSGNNGLFTEKLVKQMNNPQNITEVFQNTRVEVLKASNNTQCPQEWNMLTGNFSFVSGGNSQQQTTNTEPDDIVFNPGNVAVNYGSISIDSEIAGNLYLDGKKLGYINANSKDNNLNKIITGNHTVKIEGSETWSKNIVVGKDQTTFLTVKSTDALSGTSNNGNDLPDSLYDSRDGKSYKIVEIGSQVWMAENLAFKADNGCWTYDNNSSNVSKYGYLYNYETAKNVCPDGWHLPSDDEWKKLAKHINNQSGPFSQSEDDWIKMGKFLKAKSGWNKNGNGNDEYGFAALPAGYRGTDGSFYRIGNRGQWWSITEKNSSHAWGRNLDCAYSDFYRHHPDKQTGISVRCLRH
jgi:uncharacterized protein (TIGR02145 family)